MNLEAHLRAALADNAEGPPRPAPDIDALLARGERAQCQVAGHHEHPSQLRHQEAALHEIVSRSE